MPDRAYPAAYWMALSIPVINAIADATTNFFPHPFLNTGSLRGAFVLAFIAYVLLTQPVWTAPTIAIVAFLAYLLPLVLASSDPLYSFTGSYLQIIASLAMFPVGYRYFRSLGSIRRLHASVLVASSIMIVQFLVAQVLGLGQSVYLADSFFVGGANVQATYLFAFAILAAPLALPLMRTRSRQYGATVLLVLLLVFTIIILRRSAIAAVAAGYVVYTVLAPVKTRVLRFVVMAAVLLMLAAPLYLPVLIPRWEVRNLENRPLSEEARVAETFVVLEEMNISPQRALFGTEAFNSYGYFGVNRQLHVDWNILLHGTGIIGVLLFVIIHLVIIGYFHRHLGPFRTRRAAREMRAVFWAQVAGGAVISLSGSLTVIGYRAALYLYAGAMIGTLEAAAVRARQERGSAEKRVTA